MRGNKERTKKTRRGRKEIKEKTKKEERGRTGREMEKIKTGR